MANKRNHFELVKLALRIANDYKATISSKYDELRFNEMIRYISNERDKLVGDNPNNFDDGIVGRVIELYCRDSKSTLTKVRAQGKIDAYIPTTSGRVRAEIKTNGGQVQELLKLSDKQKQNTLIVYFSHTKKPQGTKARAEHRPVEYYDCFKVMSVADFLDNVTLKKIDSRGNIHVQPTSKLMYERFESFTDFKRNMIFEF